MRRESAENLINFFIIKRDKLTFTRREFGEDSTYFQDAQKEYDCVKEEIIEELTRQPVKKSFWSK